jgi:hypothetical protein
MENKCNCGPNSKGTVVPTSGGEPTGGVATDYGEKGIGQGDDFNTPSHPTPSVTASIDSWSARK